jgi:hypothetical protein
MPVNKARGQSDYILEVRFLLNISGGTVTVEKVSPPGAAGDISVSDGGDGLSTITIKNMKGPQGEALVFLTPRVTSMMSASVSGAYTGDDLAFTVSTESDASTLTDNVPVAVKVEAY